MQDFGQLYSKQVAKVKTNIDILDVLDDLKEIKGRRYANAFLPIMDSLTWSIVLTIDALLDRNLINKFKASIPLDAMTLLDSLRGHWEKTDHNHYRDRLFAHFIERREGETFHYME